MKSKKQNKPASEQLIKVLLVDDSQIVLDGLSFNLMFSDGIEICGKALNSKEALRLMNSENPDIVLLDISLQEDADGIELLKKIHSDFSTSKVIIFSQKKDVNAIVSTICNGARAYLSKDSTVEEIIRTIQGVLKGNGIFLGETIPESTLKQCFSGKPESKNFAFYNLSEREMNVLTWLAKGYIAKEIAEIEHIQVSTVESHKENIKSKLGLKSIIEAVVFAVQNKIISFPPHASL